MTQTKRNYAKMPKCLNAQTPKVAQKLPSTIGIGLPVDSASLTIKLNEINLR